MWRCHAQILYHPTWRLLFSSTNPSCFQTLRSSSWWCHSSLPALSQSGKIWCQGWGCASDFLYRTVGKIVSLPCYLEMAQLNQSGYNRHQGRDNVHSAHLPCNSSYFHSHRRKMLPGFQANVTKKTWGCRCSVLNVERLVGSSNSLSSLFKQGLQSPFISNNCHTKSWTWI